MHDAAASLPGKGHSRSHAPTKASGPSPEVAKDLNRVTGLHLSKATWGFLWSVVLAAGGWLTSMKLDSVANSSKLDTIAAGQTELKADVKEMRGNVERFGNRLTKVEIEQAIHNRSKRTADTDANTDDGSGGQ